MNQTVPNETLLSSITTQVLILDLYILCVRLYWWRQAAASVHVFEGDGSVVINHYGCEVGQGIHTKVSRHPRHTQVT